MNQEKRPISVEDLLRLKRAERPPAEFWNQFDRELRAKQLAALVAKRPWWHGLQHAWFRFGRYSLPLGATAVVAITFFHIRGTTPAQVEVQFRAEPVAVVAPAPGRAAGENDDFAAVARPVTSAGYAVAASPAPLDIEQAAPDFRESAAEVVADVGRSARPRIENFSTLQALTAAEVEASENAVTPSARFIAANLAAARAAEPVASLFSASHGFEARVMPARAATVEPLQQMTPPGEARRVTRFLAAMVSTNADDVSAHTTERVANRISAEELYDEVSRFGTRRGGFNMKF